jgi:hypothetical protein
MRSLNLAVAADSTRRKAPAILTLVRRPRVDLKPTVHVDFFTKVESEQEKANVC